MNRLARAVRPGRALLALFLLLALVSLAPACGDDPSAPTGTRATPSPAGPAATTAPTSATAPPPTSPAAASPSPAPTGAASGFMLRITGTNGVAFAGTCESGSAQGNTISQPVSGTVPAQLELAGSRLRCTLRHQSASGSLRVEVVRGGQVVNTSESSAGGEITFQLSFQ